MYVTLVVKQVTYIFVFSEIKSWNRKNWNYKNVIKNRPKLLWTAVMILLIEVCCD